MREVEAKELRLRVLAALAALVFVGCGGAELLMEGEELDFVGEEGAATQPITDVNQSAVKRQSIGNCWLYATASWAESLVKSYGGQEYNMSESYWTYWHWFEQIANGQVWSGELSTGGSWGVASELILRYGVMREADFIPEEATAEMSLRQKTALAAINESLKAGALSTSTARRDRALVRRELDRAFGLSAAMTSRLDAVFGQSVSRTLDRSTLSSTAYGILRPTYFRVGYELDPVRGYRRSVTLKDAIGTASSSWDPDSRSGTFAWTEVSYPSTASGRRALQIRMQKALHQAKPVITSWFVDFNALTTDGRFLAPPTTVGRQGGHMTVLEDYEVDDVPGYGTLVAGELERRPEALEAALSTTASLRFLRVKNSWGSYRPDRQFVVPGYHDLYLSYLNGPIDRCTQRASEPANVEEDSRPCLRTAPTTPQWSFVLPPGF